MGDPFSVAGTAVGITSLGIQVCQGLMKYYSQFRGYHDDINSTVLRLEGLEGILKALETVKSNVDVKNEAVSSQLHLSFQACEGCLTQLNIQLKKFGDMQLPETLQDKARLVRKRLLWPFKKETLADLQGTLDRLQNNLQLCLQVLDIDVTHAGLNALVSQGKELVLHSKVLEAQNLDQSAALHRIESSIKEVSRSQDGQTSILSAQMTYHNTNLSAQVETIQQTLSLLVTDTGQLRRPNETPPSLLSNAIGVYRDTSQSYSRDGWRNDKGNRRQRRNRLASRMSCDCYMYRSRVQQPRAWGLFMTVSQWESDHEPTCPHFSHTDFSSSVHARFAYCSRYLGVCINMGVAYTQIRGQNSMSSTISYRAIVSSDSPGFKPIKDGQGRVFDTGYWTRENSRHLLDMISHSILQSFRDGIAKPSDTGPEGETILHSACRLVARLISEHWIDGDTARSFLSSLIEAGVPVDSSNVYNETPLSTLSYWFFDNSANAYMVLLFLAQKLDSWSLVRDSYYPPRLYGISSELLSDAELRLTYEKAGPSSHLGFMQRSMPTLQNLLCSGQWDTRRPPPMPLAFWEEGLKMYPLDRVEWPALREGRGSGHDILAVCVLQGNSSTIEYLVNGGARVGHGHIHSALAHTEDWDIVVQRNIFTILARKLKEQQLGFNAVESLEKAQNAERHNARLYWNPNLSTVAAETLFEAGFSEIDTIIEGVEHDTPAWVQATGSRVDILSLSQVLNWFETKGANLNWISPQYLTSPIHVFIRKLFDLNIRSLKEPKPLYEIDSGDEEAFSTRALLSGTQDRCSCYCSGSGCLPVTCAVQEIMDSNMYTPWESERLTTPPQTKKEIQEIQRQIASYLFSRLCSAVEAKWESQTQLCTAIIRVLTFERLQMTHTCCRHIARECRNWHVGGGCWRDPKDPLRADEIDDIHNSEGKQIELLEKIVTQFEPKWNDYSGSFFDFIETVWKPYIEEELHIFCGDDEDEVRKFRELGIVLKDSESDSEG